MTQIECTPDLAEEALFHACEARAGDGARRELAQWRRERDALYERTSSRERDHAFRSLAVRWFHELDLARPIRDALSACPSASRSLASIHLRRVARFRDEGSELYGNAPGEAHVAPRLVLGLRPETFADAPALHALALRELLYADDMLDPAFAFDPSEPVGEDEERARAQLVRDRFQVLWEARVRGRSARIRGEDLPCETPARFARAFGASLPRASVDALYREVAQAPSQSFQELVAAAELRGKTAGST